MTIRRLSANDQRELQLFGAYLKRRVTKPDEPVTHTYAEVYGEVVFEDKTNISIRVPTKP